MKSSRTFLVWAAFAFCAVTILAAMAWQTRNALASERDRVAAECRADLQEKMRLSLWRMDTLGAALVIEESGGSPADFIHSRFVWKESGALSLPDGGEVSADLRKVVPLSSTSFSGCYIGVNAGIEIWKAAPEPLSLPEGAMNSRSKMDEVQQTASNNLELQKRSQAVDNVFSKNRASNADLAAAAPDGAMKKSAARERRPAAEAKAEAAAPSALPALPGAPVPAAAAPAALPPPAPFVFGTSARPVWMGNELFLLRPVSGPGRSLAGSWLDLAVLRTRLLVEIKDLLPAASLVQASTPSNDGLVLASFPLRLEPGVVPGHRAALSAPIRMSLVAGWSAALIAIGTASLLVFGIMRLSERRASFVSAVTHELRTPLTTFRLYSDMLESGAVKVEKRGDYLRVLSREADRLSHLVENVLAFSRIERGSARSAVSTARISDLLEPMRERFESRLATAGMSLRMDFDTTASTEKVRVDAAAIEHILFNLVDNAAKYASGGEFPVLEISVERKGKTLDIRVADHGPGIPLAEHRRIFRAFHKSAREAAETRPGVGLGLALSRRLARNLGGDLVCNATHHPGAAFILSLPVSGPD